MTKKEILETIGWAMKPLDALHRIENYEFNPDDRRIWFRIMGSETFNIGDLIADILDDEYDIVYEALEKYEDLMKKLKRKNELEKMFDDMDFIDNTTAEVDEWYELDDEIKKIVEEK